MYLIKYKAKEHYHIIKDWLEARELRVPPINEMPHLGYLVHNLQSEDLVHNLQGGHFIAAGFIRRVEGSFGLFDSLVTNPDSTPEERNSALDIVVNQLLTEAKARGMKKLIAFSEDKNTLLRSERFGFVKLSHTLIALDILSPTISKGE